MTTAAHRYRSLEHDRKAALKFARKPARQTRHHPYLLRLPKGEPGNAHRCPIARALRPRGGHASASSSYVYVYSTPVPSLTDPDKRVIPIPRAVQRFTRRFDQGEYPDLIDKP